MTFSGNFMPKRFGLGREVIRHCLKCGAVCWPKPPGAFAMRDYCGRCYSELFGEEDERATA